MAPSRIYAAAAALPLALALVAPPARTAPPRTFVRRHGIDVNVWEYVYNNQDPGVPLPAGCDERNPTPAPFEITSEQKEELEREGVVVIPGLLNQEWLTHLREITDWQVEHPHIWASPGVASGLYDYIQRNIWTTNDAFIKFLYHSPVSTALAQLGGAKDSVRVTTDLLMVNPNKGFKWHQDNQNGPIDAFGAPGANEWNALRWWVTLDDCPPDHGAPVYLRKSHLNTDVTTDAVTLRGYKAPSASSLVLLWGEAPSFAELEKRRLL